MTERQPLDQQMQSPPQSEDMIACVMALEAALLPCLPARELQAIDRSPHPSHQIDVERHARDFMEAAKKLQLYFIGLQHEEQPTKEEKLRKEIAVMEEELKTKSELIKKHEKLIQGWRKELKDQLDKHVTELERVVLTKEKNQRDWVVELTVKVDRIHWDTSYLFGGGEEPKPSAPAAPSQGQAADNVPAKKSATSSPVDNSKQIPAGIHGSQANNYFRADGQNTGNFITDRPSTKAHAAPDGGSSMNYLFGGSGGSIVYCSEPRSSLS